MKLDSATLNARWNAFKLRTYLETGIVPEVEDVSGAMSDDARTLVLTFRCAGGVVYRDWIDVNIPAAIIVSPVAMH